MDQSYSQALKILDILESKCGLYRITINNIPVWWFVRLRFWLALSDRLKSGGKEEKSSAVRKPSGRFAGKFLVFALRSLIGLATAAVYGKKGAVWLLAYSSDFKKTKNNPAKDINISPVYQKIKDDAIIIEMPSLNPSDFHSLLFRKKTLFFDSAIALSIMINFLKLFKKPPITHWEEFHNACIKNDFGQISPEWISANIRGLVNKFYPKIFFQIEASKIALKIFKPKAIAETTSYDSGMMAINLAAKSMGIPVAELQHGIIPDTHEGYIYFIPQEYAGPRPLPDKLLVHGQIYKDTILASSGAFSSQNIVVVGNMRMQKYLKENTDNRGAIKKKIRKILGVGQEDFLATVTSQPLQRSGLSGILEASLPVLGKNVFVCLKPHPSESDWRQVYKNILSDPRVRVVTDNEADLYDLLIASDIHITLASTVFIECLALGVPNIIVKGPNLGDISSFLEHCGLSPVETADEFTAEFKKIMLNRQYRETIISKGKNKSEYFLADIEYPENNIAREILGYKNFT